jgi:hypothetical protein
VCPIRFSYDVCFVQGQELVRLASLLLAPPAAAGVDVLSVSHIEARSYGAAASQVAVLWSDGSLEAYRVGRRGQGDLQPSAGSAAGVAGGMSVDGGWGAAEGPRPALRWRLTGFVWKAPQLAPPKPSKKRKGRGAAHDGGAPGQPRTVVVGLGEDLVAVVGLEAGTNGEATGKLRAAVIDTLHGTVQVWKGPMDRKWNYSWLPSSKFPSGSWQLFCCRIF